MKKGYYTPILLLAVTLIGLNGCAFVAGWKDSTQQEQLEAKMHHKQSVPQKS